MLIKHGAYRFCIILYICFGLCIKRVDADDSISIRRQYLESRKHRQTWASDLIHDVGCEVLGIHLNILGWDSFAVITTLFPFWVAARIIDEDLQKYFYDGDHHRNINQCPWWFHDVANWAISVPIGILAGAMLFTDDIDFCETTKTFLIGVIFVVSAKVLLKKCDFNFCLRPWHEKFSSVKRAHGGFPSGHMAEVTYITLIYGLKYGPALAIPLGLLALFVGGTFLNCNRHYLSQLVGGVALGAIYGLAAYRFIEQKLSDDFSCYLSVTADGAPAINVEYRF